MRLRVAAGKRGEIGQLGQRDVHPERSRAAAVGGDAGAEIGRQMLRRDQLFEQDPGSDVGNHPQRLDDGAVVKFDADGTSRLDDHPRDGGAGPQRDAARRAFLRHRLRDRPHAADRMTPLSALAVHFAEYMVQQDVGRPRRPGTGVVADDGVEAEGRLDRVGLEPAVEHVTGTLGEEVEDVALPRQVQRAKPPRRLPGVEQRVHAAADVRRSRQQQPAQHVGDAFEHRVVRRQRLGVAAGEFRDLRLRRGQAPTEEQMPAVGQRQEIGYRPQDDPEPVFREPEVADHPRIEEADGVACGRVPIARMEFFGDRGAA